MCPKGVKMTVRSKGPAVLVVSNAGNTGMCVAARICRRLMAVTYSHQNTKRFSLRTQFVIVKRCRVRHMHVTKSRMKSGPGPLEFGYICTRFALVKNFGLIAADFEPAKPDQFAAANQKHSSLLICSSSPNQSKFLAILVGFFV